MTTEMAFTTRTSLGPVRRLAMVLTVSVLAGIGSVAVAPVAAADEDGETSVSTSVDSEDGEDGDDEEIKDGKSFVVHNSGSGGPDAFIVMEHGRKPVFFCDTTNVKKRHKICTVPVTSGGARF